MKSKSEGAGPRVFPLVPSTHDAIWGGNALVGYGKRPPVPGSDRIAESWELSFVPGSEASDGAGRLYSERFSAADFGTACAGMPGFPVLTKFIDAREKLSVQVHPSDEYALAREKQYGKTEMWYIIGAAEGAGIYAGLRRPCPREEFRRALADGSVEDLLAFHPVKAGDVFFIPAGTIHAIGAGVLLCEIQQNSTLTYRLYDYNRRDRDGNLRPLHVDQALAVADLDVYRPAPRDEKHPEIIGKCKYFLVKEHKITQKEVFSVGEESYLCLMVIRGSGRIDRLPALPLNSFFAPAGAGSVAVVPDGEMTLLSIVTPAQ